jgi:hypothetical protein
MINRLPQLGECDHPLREATLAAMLLRHIVREARMCHPVDHQEDPQATAQPDLKRRRCELGEQELETVHPRANRSLVENLISLLIQLSHRHESTMKVAASGGTLILR